MGKTSMSWRQMAVMVVNSVTLPNATELFTQKLLKLFISCCVCSTTISGIVKKKYIKAAGQTQMTKWEQGVMKNNNTVDQI